MTIDERVSIFDSPTGRRFLMISFNSGSHLKAGIDFDPADPERMQRLIRLAMREAVLEGLPATVESTR